MEFGSVYLRSYWYDHGGKNHRAMPPTVTWYRTWYLVRTLSSSQIKSLFTCTRNRRITVRSFALLGQLRQALRHLLCPHQQCFEQVRVSLHREPGAS